MQKAIFSQQFMEDEDRAVLATADVLGLCCKRKDRAAEGLRVEQESKGEKPYGVFKGKPKLLGIVARLWCDRCSTQTGKTVLLCFSSTRLFLHYDPTSIERSPYLGILFFKNQESDSSLAKEQRRAKEICDRVSKSLVLLVSSFSQDLCGRARVCCRTT